MLQLLARVHAAAVFPHDERRHSQTLERGKGRCCAVGASMVGDVGVRDRSSGVQTEFSSSKHKTERSVEMERTMMWNS